MLGKSINLINIWNFNELYYTTDFWVNTGPDSIGSQYWGRKNADNYHALSPTLYPLPLRMRSETSDITPVPEMDISFLIYSRKEIKTIKTERKIKKKKKKKKKK